MTNVRPACQGHDGDLWFPVSYETTAGRLQTAEAIAICRTCPIQRACLQEAMDEEGGTRIEARHGIRGGYTPQARFNGRRAQTRQRTKTAA